MKKMKKLATSKKGREEGRKKEQRYRGTASLTYNWS